MKVFAATFWALAGLVGILARPRLVTTPRDCRACAHYRPLDVEGGHCRRYAPIPAPEPIGRWPIVLGSDRCGEFERDPEGPKPDPVPESPEAFRKRILGDTPTL